MEPVHVKIIADDDDTKRSTSTQSTSTVEGDLNSLKDSPGRLPAVSISSQDVYSYFETDTTPDVSSDALRQDAGGQKKPGTNIFQVKTPEEVTQNYNRLMSSLGKWNADMYIEVLEMLRKEENDSRPISPPCSDWAEEIRKEKCIDIKERIPRSKAPPAMRYDTVFTRYCEVEEAERGFPEDRPGEQIRQPTYKDIFKNARLRKIRQAGTVKVNKEKSVKVIPLEKSIVTVVGDPKSVTHFKCDLLKDQEYNIVKAMRKKRENPKEPVQEGKISLSTLEEMDQIGELFDEKPVEQVMRDQLAERVQYVFATLGGDQTYHEDGQSNEHATGGPYLCKTFMGNTEAIEEFDKRYQDSRWRKKFELDKLEMSGADESTDVDIPTSDSSSMCSCDSETSLDLKTSKPQPSKIPYAEEIYRRRDVLYDKISAKWDKVVRKNLIEPNFEYIVNYKYLYNDARLRGHRPNVNKLLNILDADYQFYPKSFIPYKRRKASKLNKMTKMQNESAAVRSRWEELEKAAVTKEPKAEEKTIDFAPTKFQNQKARSRLKSVMRDTERRGAVGLAAWKKRDLFEDYVNLLPILSSRKPSKSKGPLESISVLESKTVLQRRLLRNQPQNTSNLNIRMMSSRIFD